MPAPDIYFRITNRAARSDLPKDGAPPYAVRARRRPVVEAMSEFVLAGILIALVTGVSFALEPLTGYVSVALLYLLLVVALGLRMRRGTVLAVAAASALLRSKSGGEGKRGRFRGCRIL